MSTQFTNRQWRLPNNENKDKQSNYSLAGQVAGKINISSPATVGITASFSFWLKRPDVNHDTQPYAIGTNYGMYMFDTNGLYIRYGAGHSGLLSSTALQTALASTDWVHWVIIREEVTATTQNLRIYANNVLVESQNNTSSFGTGNSEVNEIMRVTQDNQDRMDGFAIFNYALSSSQVTTLYGSSSTGIGNPMSLSPKPVAYYPLGDQNAFNGSNYLVPNSSLKDYVFDFDGTSGQEIAINNNTLINGYTSVTFSFWFKGKTGLANFDGLLCQRSSSGKYNLIHVDGVSGSNYRIFIQQNGTSYAKQTTDAILELDKWHHICIKGTVGNIWNIYVDGLLSNYFGSAQNISNIVQDTNPFRIGRDGNTNVAVGEFSNVQIFNTALPATGSNSIETLYNNGSPLTSMSGFTSLQGWWKLDASDTYDSSTGNWTIEDHAGSNDGTSSGMTQANLVQSDLSFTSGYSPYALDFDSASSDYIDCGNNASLYPRTGDMSYSFWVNPDVLSGLQTIYGKTAMSTSAKGVNINLSGSEVRVFMGVGVSGQWGINTGGGTGGGALITSNSGLTVGQWSHIVLTLDRDGDGVIYINGVAVVTAAMNPNDYSSVDIVDSRSNLIGNGNAYSNVKISNMSVWNTSLTSAQVTEIYNEGVPSNLNNHSAYSNLVSWWQLGSNSSFNTNWTVLDEKGSNNGTSVNMTEDDIVDGVGSYANGLSSGMGGDEVIGDAPYSSSNSLSVNMDVLDRVEDTPA